MRDQFADVSTLIAELQAGRMIILVDDENRENEGDLILPAQFASAENINFMITHARGLVCLSLTPQHVDRLQLPLMVPENENGAPNKTAFTLSIEAAQGITTGISAKDRAHTIRVASNPQAKPTDVSRPGHIFPLKARLGGVLERPGHTEASVDYMKLAGLVPAAVICEVMNEDGTMARLPELVRFAQKHQLKIGTIHDLIEDLNGKSKTKIEKQNFEAEKIQGHEANL
jgi:3,4-dihydroxy 2-butanone 4-phosphate synthase/GTP cyclohydrolase II